MFVKNDNEFICMNCNRKVEKLKYTSRDYCNHCLYSIHIDITPGDRANGELSYPCFNLVRALHNSPVNIANTIKDKIVFDEKISKVEVVNGFLNFYQNNDNIVNDVLKEILEKKEEYGSSESGKRTNIIVDYSSSNIAKTYPSNVLFNPGSFSKSLPVTVLGAV